MDDSVATRHSNSEAKENENRREGWFFNPYTQIALCILLSAAAQLLLKKGAIKAVPSVWLGVRGLLSGWVWLGIIAMVGSLFSWLYSLRFLPLIIAFNLTAMVQVLVPVASSLFLGEQISPMRVCGIALVCAGVYVVARPLMRMEEKL